MRMMEVRVAGFGGQGVILAAMIVGKAGSIFENGYATLTQNFGPEARGSACSAQVILSDQPILYPYITRPDILVVMSQDAYNKFAPEVKDGGIVLVEEDLVHITAMRAGVGVFAVPATRLAEELGKKMVLNIVMIGFFAAVTGLLKPEALREAVADSVPEAFIQLNLKAFDKGYEYGLKRMSTEAAHAQAPLETE